MSRKFSKREYFLPFSHLDADVFVHISTFEYAIPFRCNTRFDQLSEIRARRKTPSFQRHINLKGSKSVVNCSISGNAEHFFIPSRCISPCGNILLPEFMPFLTNREIGILVYRFQYKLFLCMIEMETLNSIHPVEIDPSV